MWQVIPESETKAVREAIVDGRCVVCYGAVGDGHVFYCHDCDDGCGEECAGVEE